tara:strand:- start:4944 stop:6002 length:1059 start_codon:yes stop_codon:yes gene_type:complete
VDGRALQGNITGIGKFLLSALQSFSKLNVTCIILHNKEINEEVETQLQLLGHQVYLDHSIFCKNSFAWVLFRLPFLLSKFDFDFIWFPNNFGTFLLNRKRRVLLTVHDSVYLDYPFTMNWPEKLLSWLMLKRSIRNADILWFISEYTKSRYVESFDIGHAKIVMGSDIDRALFNEENRLASTKDTLSKYNVNGRYLLFVGTTEPRKNLKFLGEISKEISQLGLSIIVVGTKGWGGGGGDFIYPGYVSDSDLPAFYKFADLYVSTSLHEGFGLPLVEAQSMGAPVVCANNSAQPEVIGEGGVTVTGWKHDAWILAIKEVIKNKNYYSCLSLENSKKFSMDKVCQNIIDTYYEI